MASIAFNHTIYTRRDTEPVVLNMSTDISTSALQRSAVYGFNIIPQQLQTAAGPNVQSDVTDLLLQEINREIKQYSYESEEETSASVAVIPTILEITVNRETCASTQTATALGATARIFDTYLKRSQLVTSGITFLSDAGMLTTLPRSNAPVHWSFANLSGAQIQIDRGEVDAAFWTFPNNAITAIGISGPAITQDSIQITINENTNKQKTIRRVYSDCLTELVLAKERKGGFVATGYTYRQDSPGAQRQYVKVTPQPPINAIYRQGEVPKRQITLIRENVSPLERDTFAAFAQGIEFYFWDKAEDEYKPCTLLGITQITRTTKRIELNIQIDVD